MNYLKISGQLVCKMLVLLAFAFAACSDNQVSGGVTEETRVYALSGRVGDVCPKLLKVADSSGVYVDTVKYEGSVFAEKGSIITVYELDSLTLDTTGRFFVDTVDNDSGHFEFKEMNLRSPYVLIGEQVSSPDVRDKRGTIVYTYYNYSAIVDLRNVKNVSISTLTTMKVPLLQKYFAEGNSFAQASKMAEREILEEFGVYEDLGAFEKMNEDGSELPYVNTMARLSESDIRSELNFETQLYYSSPKAFSNRKSAVEQFYLNSMKMIKYMVNYLANKDGLGRCDEAHENVSGDVGAANTRLITIVCRSGSWTLGFKTVAHTKGTMTDERDGKIYKTVTYNWGDVSQTWMAENLSFTDTTSSLIDSALKSNLSGRISCFLPGYGWEWFEQYESGCDPDDYVYQWKAAMNIGDGDVNVYSIDSLGDTTFVDKAYLDSLEHSYDWTSTYFDWTWNYDDFVISSNRNSYQGVCPDGWRIPTAADWMTLLQNLGNEYDVDYEYVVPTLYDETATGFGLNAHAKAWFDETLQIVRFQYNGFSNAFVIVDKPLYIAEFFDRWSPRCGFGIYSCGVVDHTFIFGYWNLHLIDDDYHRSTTKTAFVRCIKN
ncbi:FISUMP domain-containing protein [Fibrobacter succinogenes]|uniref:FISUMP domain-containing protein n=1 Tax=Fibrobacter succinogenes TaxID=833 RepID=UPI0015681126|nr:FISUMP domain-containing protein [Fibrobacter succinogenes]